MARTLAVQAAPDRWWDGFVPTGTDTYVPPTYAPPSSANRNHALFSAVRDNDFDKSSDSYENGLITGMGIIAGVGVLCLLFAPLAYAYIGRRANCCHATKAKRPGAGGAAIVFGLMWAIAAAGFGLTVYGSVEMNTHVTSAGEDAGQVATLLTQAQQLAAEAADAAAQTLTVAQSIMDEGEKCVTSLPLPLPTAKGQVGEELVAKNRAAVVEQLRTYADAVAALAASDNFNDAIRMTQNVSDGIDDSQAWRLPVIAVVATIFGICMLIYLATAILIILKGKPIFKRRDGTFAARCSLRALTAVTVTSLILMWALFTAAIGSAMAGGDFCQDPDANTVAVADGNTVVAFYVNCQGDDPLFTAVSQGQEALVTAMGTLAPLADKIFGNRLVAAVCNANVAALGDSLDRLNSLSYRASTLGMQAQEDFSCRTINGLYVDAVYETGCRDINAALGFMMAGLGLLTLGLMLAILAWRLIVAQAQTTPDKMPLSTFATPKPKPMPEPIAPVADPTLRDDDHETTDSSPNEGAAPSAS